MTNKTDLYFFLFDNNVLHKLCKTKDSQNVINFKNVIYIHQILREIKEYTLLYSPFSVIEALSLKIPSPLDIEIDKNELKTNDMKIIFASVFNQAKMFYKNHPILSRKNINEKLNEELSYVNEEAKYYYDNLVTDIVKDNNFLAETISALSMDFAIKYNYPKVIAPELNGFFAYQFLVDDVISNLTSKFRLAKKLWSYIYQKEKNSGKYENLEKVNFSMRLKNSKDYLDADIIHYLCFGKKFDSYNHKVCVFTEDSVTNIYFRISIYKWLIEYIKIFATISNPQLTIPEIKLQNGLLVKCSEDFNKMSVINVAEIPPLFINAI